MFLVLRERLLNNLKQRKEDLSSLLIQGKADDYAHYCHLTGHIKGINDSIELVRNMFKEEDEII